MVTVSCILKCPDFCVLIGLCHCCRGESAYSQLSLSSLSPVNMCVCVCVCVCVCPQHKWQREIQSKDEEIAQFRSEMDTILSTLHVLYNYTIKITPIVIYTRARKVNVIPWNAHTQQTN